MPNPKTITYALIKFCRNIVQSQYSTRVEFAVIAFLYVSTLSLPNITQLFDKNKKKRYLTFEHKFRKSRNLHLHFYLCFVYFVDYIFSVASVECYCHGGDPGYGPEITFFLRGSVLYPPACSLYAFSEEFLSSRLPYRLLSCLSKTSDPRSSFFCYQICV